MWVPSTQYRDCLYNHWFVGVYPELTRTEYCTTLKYPGGPAGKSGKLKPNLLKM
jgi:hypothetical protein